MCRSEKRELSQEETSGKEKSTPRPGYQTAEPGAPSAFFWFVNRAKVHSFNRRRMFKNIGISPRPLAKTITGPEVPDWNSLLRSGAVHFDGCVIKYSTTGCNHFPS